MTRFRLGILLPLAVAAAFTVAAPLAQAAPATEEYEFRTPSAGDESGAAGSSGNGSGVNPGSSDSGAAVPILAGVLVLTAATGAGIAILRRQRT